MHDCVLKCSVVLDSLWPHGLWPTRLLCPWNSLGKNTGMGSHCLLKESFPTQGSNSGLLHYRWILYHWVTRKAQKSIIFTRMYPKRVYSELSITVNDFLLGFLQTLNCDSPSSTAPTVLGAMTLFNLCREDQRLWVFWLFLFSIFLSFFFFFWGLTFGIHVVLLKIN